MNITVFERSNYVGGRSTTVDVYGDRNEPVELGASIFVSVNRILVSAAQEFGLSTKNPQEDKRDDPPDVLGVWDGKEFKFIQSQGSYSWWNIAKLLWKYGLAPVRTQNLMRKTVGHFLRMYDEPHFPFRSLSEKAYDLGLTDSIETTGDYFLLNNQISKSFATDIVQASTRVNYAQNLREIHGLETMVCMATDGAMAIEGGNWQIFHGMAKASGARIALNTSVREIQWNKDSYTIQSTLEKSPAALGELQLESFDSVVIATPLQFSNISITSALAHTPDKIRYVTLHVTLFTSPHKLSPSKFNLHPDASVPGVVLTTLPDNAVSDSPDIPLSPFFSISTLRSIRNPSFTPARPEYLYKVFSRAPIDATLMSQLLGFPDLSSSSSSSLETISKNDISWLYEKTWNSYPYLPPRATFEDPQLEANLWYTSGIESFISTMETSALMGMNVARLIVDDWVVAATKRVGQVQGEL